MRRSNFFLFSGSMLVTSSIFKVSSDLAVFIMKGGGGGHLNFAIPQGNQNLPKLFKNSNTSYLPSR